MRIPCLLANASARVERVGAGAVRGLGDGGEARAGAVAAAAAADARDALFAEGGKVEDAVPDEPRERLPKAEVRDEVEARLSGAVVQPSPDRAVQHEPDRGKHHKVPAPREPAAARAGSAGERAARGVHEHHRVVAVLLPRRDRGRRHGGARTPGRRALDVHRKRAPAWAPERVAVRHLVRNPLRRIRRVEEGDVDALSAVPHAERPAARVARAGVLLGHNGGARRAAGVVLLARRRAVRLRAHRRAAHERLRRAREAHVLAELEEVGGVGVPGGGGDGVGAVVVDDALVVVADGGAEVPVDRPGRRRETRRAIPRHEQLALQPIYRHVPAPHHPC
mmetsp:Transcript_13849/g.45525  ORF Transcript_13849/g.45525 Transcript_13849/m.45525 type:complete len:336 (+) Transcript_13849:8-1015(+)